MTTPPLENSSKPPPSKLNANFSKHLEDIFGSLGGGEQDAPPSNN